MYNCSSKVVLDAAVKAGAPEGIIGWIDVPSLELTTTVMRDSDEILATGVLEWLNLHTLQENRHLVLDLVTHLLSSMIQQISRWQLTPSSFQDI